MANGRVFVLSSKFMFGDKGVGLDIFDSFGVEEVKCGQIGVGRECAGILLVMGVE